MLDNSFNRANSSYMEEHSEQCCYMCRKNNIKLVPSNMSETELSPSSTSQSPSPSPSPSSPSPQSSTTNESHRCTPDNDSDTPVSSVHHHGVVDDDLMIMNKNMPTDSMSPNPRKKRRLIKFVLQHFFIVIFTFLVILTTKNIQLADCNEMKASDVKSVSESGVCQSIDVRNNPDQLRRLQNCRVVEGFVQILLIEKFNESSYEDYSFPLLTEITDYLLLFRVNGLKSLRKLFPNLSVIRGKKLINNYALVIYEIMHLQEIGLISLTHVGRGAIRVEKNPMLCYVNSIDWTLIARDSSQEDHYIVSNKKDNECPICPGSKNRKGEYEENDSKDVIECPRSPSDNKKRLCWNLQHCQKVCPQHCGNGTCNENNQCCDSSCLAGCSGPKLDNCTICRQFSIGDKQDKRCVSECPENTFLHMDRRCIQSQECYKIKKPLELQNDDVKFPYTPFNKSCTLECPPKYYAIFEGEKKVCKECDGPCRKTCEGANIDSIDSAQQLRGCTIITGSLEIQIRSQGGLNIVKELERSLSTIEEIGGYLKVVRSFPLLSLNFLKNLKVIRGNHNSQDTAEKKEKTAHSLMLLDNQNLQDLWDHNVKVEKGTMFFHFNPKLCFYKCEKLLEFAGEGVEIDTIETARTSNGDRTACNVTELIVRVKKTASEVAILEWDPLQLDDERKLLGYVLYYITAPFKNVTLFDGRDACGGDGWHVDDITDFSSSDPIQHLLTRLEPYTQYAFYVKTYTITSEKSGAQSQIQYFRTDPGKPDKVEKLKMQVSHNETAGSTITISWEPPLRANGNLTQYIIKGLLNTEGKELLNQRNYCNEPLKFVSETDLAKQHEAKPTTDPGRQKCDCDEFCDAKITRNKIADQAEVEQQIQFEDLLHNWVYIKNKKETTRSKRSALTSVPINATLGDDTHLEFPHLNANNSLLDSELESTISHKVVGEDYYDTIYEVVNSSVTKYKLQSLKHYSLYTIKVVACRDGIESNCSMDTIINFRTPKKEGADNILSFHVTEESSNQTLGSVRVTWTDPKKPNGLIVTYTIKYQRVDLEQSKPQYMCITHKHFQNLSGSYLIKSLETGNYSIQIMATSLAGDGDYTIAKYILIEQNSIKWVIIGVTVALLFVCIVIGIFVYYYRKMKYLPVINMKLIASVNPDYAGVVYKVDAWEVAREDILQLHELGQGSFGMVYQGIVKRLKNEPVDIPCAVKTVNENATDKERSSFLNEASVMKQFDTNHVVRLLGVVSQGQPTLVIMELMTFGDLKKYLRSHRPDYENGDHPSPQPPTLRRILQMAIEIGDGMAYLSAKKFVHRDLAARNCMVAEDLTVKIGDFGMTRDIYETDYYRKGTKGFLPVRWMSPESLKDGVFTSSSDVFSYGVVLWEMATLASQPYQGLTNDQVLRYVIDGGVMERPENCPDKLYDMMRQCWQHRPSARPSFIEIIGMLLADADPSFRELSFYFSPDAEEIVAQNNSVQVTIDDVRTPLRQNEYDDTAHSSRSVVHGEYSMDRIHSHLGDEENLPLPEDRLAHSPLSESNGTGIFCDSIAISYHSSDNDNITVNGINKSSVSPSYSITSSNYPRHSRSNADNYQKLCNDENDSISANRIPLIPPPPPKSSFIAHEQGYDKMLIPTTNQLMSNRTNRKNGRISETDEELRPLRNGFVVNLK